MLLNRNMMALALISAGLCFTAGVRAAQDTSGTSTATAPQTTTSPTTAAAATAPQTTTAPTSGTQSSAKTNPNGQTQQQQLTKSLDAITVTGFSNGVEKSTDYQRYADNIQDVVTASDIGGLPDQSIADALTRLPGVAAERIAGQASQINCRGLSGNFIETTLNGREQPTASGSNYIDFDQYPSELINQATVYKTSQANLIEGGVGCTIEMTTANPLDNSKEQSLDIDTRGSYDGQAHDVTGANALGYRFSAAWQGKFLDDTLGVGLGVAQLYQPHVSEQFVGESFNGLQTLDSTNPNSPQGYVPTGIQLQQNGGEERRTGYLATVVWRPDDHLQLTADAYDSKFDDQSFGYGYRSQLFNAQNGVNPANITNPVFGANQTVLGGTVTSANIGQFSNETTADNDTTDTNVFTGGLNMKWNDGNWHVEADASLSHTESDNVNSDVTADPFTGLGTANPTLMPQSTTYLLTGGKVGTASFANPGIYTNLNDMAIAQYGVYPYVYHEENKALRLNVKYDLNNNPIFSGLEAGVYDNNHDYEADRSAWIYGNEYTGGGSGAPPLPLSSSDTSVVCWQGSFAGFPCFLKMNGPAVLAAYGLTANPQKTWANAWTEIQSGSVSLHEKDAFFMADIDSTLFDHSVTGNIGMRVVHTDQSSDGVQEVDNGEGVPMTDGTGVVSDDFKPLDISKSYTDYLPSLNLTYHWDDSDQTRLGFSKDLSRAPINQELSGSGSYYTNGTTYNVYGSTSASLNPLIAWSEDLDYEHYFDNSSGLVSAGVFAKQIKSFVQDVVYNNFDFASAGITVPINPATGLPWLNGEYQTAANVTGGTERGVELSFSKTHFLPGIWSGLGVSANYAYTASAVQFSSTLGGYPQNQTMPGLSRKVASAALFYDNGIFTSNLTVNYRSSFVSDSQIAVTNQIVYFAPETVWDFQSAYNVTKNVSVLFQILDIFNQPTRTYFGNPSQTGTIQYFGRTLYTGVNIKL